MKILIAGSIILVLFFGAAAFVYLARLADGGSVLADNLSEPLNGATAAKVDINCGPGHLTIDPLTGSEQLLAGGTLQYLESQGLPTRALASKNGQATLTLRGSENGAGRSGFRFPWQACGGGAFEWQIHLNPTVASDITAHSDGGNVKLNLARMAVSHLSADTGGGNMDVVLPDNAANLSVAVKTGAGNVTVEIGSNITGHNTVDASSGAGNVVVRVPGGIAARIHANTGLGKTTVDSRFNKTDEHTYQSSDYDGAADRVEITVNSGTGNVNINTP